MQIVGDDDRVEALAGERPIGRLRDRAARVSMRATPASVASASASRSTAMTRAPRCRRSSARGARSRTRDRAPERRRGTRWAKRSIHGETARSARAAAAIDGSRACIEACFRSAARRLPAAFGAPALRRRRCAAAPSSSRRFVAQPVDERGDVGALAPHAGATTA